MSNNKGLTSQELNKAVAVFTALSILDSTKTSKGIDKRSHIHVSQLYPYATKPDIPIPFELQQAIRRDKKLQQAFYHLLEKCANYYLPNVAAASSGEITERETGNFRLRLLPSKVEPTQLYLIIELLADNITPPQSLFLYDESGDCQKHILPPPQDDKIQLLIQSDSELAMAIRKHNSEIFLR
jgi:hypothetical protein